MAFQTSQVHHMTTALLFFFLYIFLDFLAFCQGFPCFFVRFPSEGREWGIRSVVVGFHVFSGRPDPEVPKNKHLGTSGLTSDAPKTRIQPRQSQPPGPLTSFPNDSRGGSARIAILVVLVISLRFFPLSSQEETLRDSGTTTKYSKWHFPVEKSVDFPPWVLLTFPGNPVIFAVERRLPHYESGKNNRRIL